MENDPGEKGGSSPFMCGNIDLGFKRRVYMTLYQQWLDGGNS